MIDVSYNKDENIIYVVRLGNITLHDIVTNIKGLDSNFADLDELYILEDLRNSISKLKEDDYPTIIGEIKKRIVNFKFVKTAVIVDSPADTVLGLLYEEIAEEVKNYYFKTFSTVKEAERWLRVGI